VHCAANNGATRCDNNRTVNRLCDNGGPTRADNDEGSRFPSGTGVDPGKYQFGVATVLHWTRRMGERRLPLDF
jgi:hypothetical protein